MNCPNCKGSSCTQCTREGWHRHPNGGGWVEDTATVAETAYVGPSAQVFGEAQVFGKAYVAGSARVSGNAEVSGDAEVSGKARVSGNAEVFGHAIVSWRAEVSGLAAVSGQAEVSGLAAVSGNATVSGTAKVSGNAKVSEDATVSGNAEVCGDAQVFGDAYVYRRARVSGQAKVTGEALVSGQASVSGNAEVSGNARVLGRALVGGHAYVSGHAEVSGQAKVSDRAIVLGDALVSGYAVVNGEARVSEKAQVFGTAVVSGSPELEPGPKEPPAAALLRALGDSNLQKLSVEDLKATVLAALEPEVPDVGGSPTVAVLRADATESEILSIRKPFVRALHPNGGPEVWKGCLTTRAGRAGLLLNPNVKGPLLAALRKREADALEGLACSSRRPTAAASLYAFSACIGNVLRTFRDALHDAEHMLGLPTPEGYTPDVEYSPMELGHALTPLEEVEEVRNAGDRGHLLGTVHAIDRDYEDCSNLGSAFTALGIQVKPPGVYPGRTARAFWVGFETSRAVEASRTEEGLLGAALNPNGPECLKDHPAFQFRRSTVRETLIAAQSYLEEGYPEIASQLQRARWTYGLDRGNVRGPCSLDSTAELLEMLREGQTYAGALLAERGEDQPDFVSDEDWAGYQTVFQDSTEVLATLPPSAALARNPETPPDRLRELYAKGKGKFAVAVLQNRNCPQAFLIHGKVPCAESDITKAIRKEKTGVGQIHKDELSNPDLTENQLLNNPNFWQAGGFSLRAVVLHPNAGLRVWKRAAQTSDGLRALKRANIPNSVKEELKGNSSVGPESELRGYLQAWETGERDPTSLLYDVMPDAKVLELYYGGSWHCAQVLQARGYDMVGALEIEDRPSYHGMKSALRAAPLPALCNHAKDYPESVLRNPNSTSEMLREAWSSNAPEHAKYHPNLPEDLRNAAPDDEVSRDLDETHSKVIKALNLALETREGWHRHVNGGGWVEDTATVDQTAFVGPGAEVRDNAVVRDHARILDKAVVQGRAAVLGEAQVCDAAKICGRASVVDKARVFGHAKVCGRSIVSNNAEVSGNAVITAESYVGDSARVWGEAMVKAAAKIGDWSRIHGSAQVGGECQVRGSTEISGGVVVGGSTNILNSTLSGSAQVLGQAILRRSTVKQRAILEGAAIVLDSHMSGYAKVRGQSKVSDSIVEGCASIKGGTVSASIIRKDAVVEDRAEVSNARVEGYAVIRGEAVLRGPSKPLTLKVEGHSSVADNATLLGSVHLKDGKVGGRAYIAYHVTVAEGARIDGDARVEGGLEPEGNLRITKNLTSGSYASQKDLAPVVAPVVATTKVEVVQPQGVMSVIASSALAAVASRVGDNLGASRTATAAAASLLPGLGGVGEALQRDIVAGAVTGLVGEATT